MNFKEGQDVKKGDVLARIDPTTYQAALDQTLAKKAQDEAQLANAKNDLVRYAKLAANNAINKQQADTQKALVAQYTALVQSDQAAIENARALLGYTTVTAPIDGRTGIRQVDEGNIVRASDANSAIVVIAQIKPISVLFNLPQQDLTRVNAAFAKGPLGVDAQRSDNNAVLDRGTLTVVDNQVDPSTGTVKLKAEFPNANVQLWPGQFVNVRLLINTLKDVVVIPTGAVQRGPNGTFVYVIDDQNKAAMRPITVSKQDEAQAVVSKGVTPAERVVTTGFARLTDGAKVSISGGARTPPAATPPGGARASVSARPVTAPAPVSAGGAMGAAAGRTHRNERLLPLHPPADRHLAARRRGDAGRRARLLVAAGLGVAASRLSDHPGHHPASRRQSGHHCLAGDGAARAPVRPDPGLAGHDLVELVRGQPGHAAIRSQPRHRRRRAGRAIGDQCCRLHAAAQPALPAALFQSEPGRHADRHAGADLGLRSTCAR